MKEYFLLQYTILQRQLIEFGIKPVFGYLLGTVVFTGLTVYLWSVTTFAPYLYALMGLSVAGMMADPGKVVFLRQHFPHQITLRIRMVENLMAVTPFVIGLLCYQAWWIAAGMVGIAGVLAFSLRQTSVSMVIPTPFGQYPFEFLTGFRKNILILLLVAGVLVMAIRNDNLNLALFTCAVVWLIALTFYATSEPAYVVWVHHLGPAGFLWHKIKVAVVYATLMMLPYALATILFFHDTILPLALIWILGWLYLATVILGKYAFYPSSMSVPQGILMAISFGFPPLLLVLIPYFYRQSLRRLQPILA